MVGSVTRCAATIVLLIVLPGCADLQSSEGTHELLAAGALAMDVRGAAYAGYEHPLSSNGPGFHVMLALPDTSALGVHSDAHLTISLDSLPSAGRYTLASDGACRRSERRVCARLVASGMSIWWEPIQGGILQIEPATDDQALRGTLEGPFRRRQGGPSDSIVIRATFRTRR
jgi:hypothetical protein